LRQGALLLIRPPRGNAHYEDQIERAYALVRLAQLHPRLPAFMEEGIAHVCVALDINSDRVISGQLPLESGEITSLVRMNRLLPLSDLISINHDAPQTFQPSGMWAIQSSIFVHLGLYGTGPYNYRKAFLQLVGTLRQNPPDSHEHTEQLLVRAFGKPVEKVANDLRGYCEWKISENIVSRPKKGSGIKTTFIEPEPVSFVEALDGQIARIKALADLSSAALDRIHQYATGAAAHLAAAQTEYSNAYYRGARDPDMLAEWGLFLIQSDPAKNFQLSLKLLELAFAGGNRNPSACLVLGRLRFDTALAKPEGKNRKFNEAQTRTICVPIGFSFQTPESFVLIAQTWLHSEVRPDKNDLATLNDAASFFPSNAALASSVARLDQISGQKAEAISLLTVAISATTDATAKESLLKLQNEIQSGFRGNE
jgi:hypothetical protein